MRIQMPDRSARSSMNQPAQHYKNRVLAAIPEAGISRVARHLEPVTLEQFRLRVQGSASSRHGARVTRAKHPGPRQWGSSKSRIASSGGALFPLSQGPASLF